MSRAVTVHRSGRIGNVKIEADRLIVPALHRIGIIQVRRGTDRNFDVTVIAVACSGRLRNTGITAAELTIDKIARFRSKIAFPLKRTPIAGHFIRFKARELTVTVIDDMLIGHRQKIDLVFHNRRRGRRPVIGRRIRTRRGIQRIRGRRGAFRRKILNFVGIRPLIYRVGCSRWSIFIFDL